MNQKNDQTVAHQAADVVDHVADGIKSAAQGATESVRNAAHTVRQAAGRAASAVGETCEEVGQHARDTLNRGRARARSLENSFECSIRENPKTSLLLAVAVGVVIGAWWNRR